MKYIFVTGAPGSKWSSVVKNIYYSNSIDRSDSSINRTYRDELHLGAYWDPGMEFGKFFHRLNEHGWFECEAEFDQPFTGTGVRIVKSHVFAHHVDYIKANWPDCPIVLVHRSTDACLGWWVRCGGFDIAYPDYKPYYQDLATIGQHIQEQNAGIEKATVDYSSTRKTPQTNLELCDILGIERPNNYIQHYQSNDIKVTVI